MSLDMVCNFRKCRRALSSQAWVTICSHAFCVEHGQREFKRNAENSLTCPACGNELRNKFDVIQADLNPSDTFKSIVLAGMKPDTIMDIAMRAISFWSYQVEQETLYQESLAKHCAEKLRCLDELNALNLQKLKAELETCKRKILSLQSDYNKKRKQADELTVHLDDKTRRIQKLTFQLETLKRKDLHDKCNGYGHIQYDRENCASVSEIVDKQNSKGFVFRPAKDTDPSRVLCSSNSQLFNFQNKSRSKSSFLFKPMSS